MAQVQFEQVVQAVQALSPTEQRQLRALLDVFLTPTPAATIEDAFAQKLVECGVLGKVNPPITDMVMPAPAYARASSGGHPVFGMGAAAYPGVYARRGASARQNPYCMPRWLR